MLKFLVSETDDPLRFTGYDTLDLKDAKAILDELA